MSPKAEIHFEGHIPLWAVVLILVLAVIANAVYWFGLLDAIQAIIFSGGLGVVAVEL